MRTARNAPYRQRETAEAPFVSIIMRISLAGMLYLPLFVCTAETGR